MKGRGSPSVKKTPDGCNVNKEWVSGLLQCHSQITVRCWSGSGGAELLVLVIRKVHRVRMIMRCHIWLLWSNDAVRAFLIRSFSTTCDYTIVMMVKAHDWQFDWEYQPPTHVMELFTFFSTCDIFSPLLKHDVCFYCTFPLRYIFQNLTKKRVEKEKKKVKKARVMIDATQLNVSVMHNVFPCYFSQVNSAQSNKAICNYNNMCWSEMLRVIQHVYIMPSSGWGGLDAWQLLSAL